MCVDRGQVATWLDDLKVLSLPPGQGNLVNKDVIIAITAL